jgi:hypothetical protein
VAGKAVVVGKMCRVVVKTAVVVNPVAGNDEVGPSCAYASRTRIAAPANGAAAASFVAITSKGRRRGVAGTGFLCSSLTIVTTPECRYRQ